MKRSARYTTLPGGARIALHTHLDARRCAICHVLKDATEYLKTHRRNRNGALELSFGATCQKCEPPPRPFPQDLRGARFTASYRNESGKIVGWFQRDQHGRYGEERSLEELTVRLTGGVIRPQPKLRRVKGNTRGGQRPPALKDSRRFFTNEDLWLAVIRQKERCDICREHFSEDNPPVADHRIAHARGGATTSENCRALCVRCNSIKSDKSATHARGRLRLWQAYKAQKQMAALSNSKQGSLWDSRLLK